MTDQERDMHLREALRHAPDAQVQPPPSLSALILSEARAKARDAKAPEPPARHPLLALWDWLARPSVAAGFAGLMVATLVGVMWWDQPMNEALPQRPAPAAAPAVTAPPVAAPPVASAPEAPPPAPAAEAESRAPEPPRAALRKAAPEAGKATVAPAKPAAPAPPPAAPAPTTRDELAADAKAGLAPPVRESSIAALSLPPPVVPAPPAQAAAPAVTAGALAKSKSTDESESKRARSMAPAGGALGYAAPQAELSDSRVKQDVQARTTLVRLRAAIAADPTHWAWQRGDGTAQSMNDAVYAWLAQLDNATGSRWQPRASRETGALLGRELRLLHDGRLEHSLRLTEHGVLWEQGQSAWQVNAPADQISALQSALDTVAP